MLYITCTSFVLIWYCFLVRTYRFRFFYLREAGRLNGNAGGGSIRSLSVSVLIQDAPPIIALFVTLGAIPAALAAATMIFARCLAELQSGEAARILIGAVPPSIATGVLILAPFYGWV